jgi:hypothetical protein
MRKWLTSIAAEANIKRKLTSTSRIFGERGRMVHVLTTWRNCERKGRTCSV